MSSRSLIAVGLVATVVGCGACGGKKDGQGGSSGSGGKGSGSAHAEGGAKRLPLTAARLKPTLHALGATKAAPTSIVIEFATPISDPGGGTSGTTLKLTPEVPGSLVVSGVSELTFTPSKPFSPGQHYEVELTQVETLDGPLTPPAGTAWKLGFDTPAFGFLGWAPTELDAAHHRVVMQLAFSGPVLPNLARAALALTVDGNPIKGVALGSTRDHDLLSVELTDPAIKVGAKLAVTSIAKLPSATGAATTSLAASYVVGTEAVVAIKTARAVEGASGFYVEVVCDDKAAGEGHRSYYDLESYAELSRRCQLTDEALGRVHFEPAVKGVYVTAGSAGFRVFGDFHRGAYTMTIDPGATTLDGGTVLAPFAHAFAVSARKPQLQFAASGRYLPRTAWSELGIKHVNADQAELVVRQVPVENLTFWLGNDGSDAADERTSDVILDKTVALGGADDAAATTWLDVASLLPATTRGILELKLSGPNTSATSRLLLTNLSLVAKKTTTADKPWLQHVQVWALDMDTAQLVDGVEVKLVRKSGKSVATCTTAGGQGCNLASSNEDDPDHAEPFALIARKGDDLTYLRYADLRAEVAESNTSGAPYVGVAPYRAAVYADRGVYRPGDTAHVVAIVRDDKDRAPSQPLPVDVEVVDPRTKVVRKLTLPTNPGGVVALDQALPAFADTGHWRISMTVADKPLAAYDLLVEEFVPERMRVTATAHAADVLATDKVSFDVAASYLFGGSAFDSGVELTCAVAPTRFSPKENADLVYGVAPKGKPVNLGEAKDQLDPKGELTLACGDDSGHAPSTQTGEVTATVAVLEAGSGRATVRTATATVHPERYYLGLRTKATRAAAGEAFAVDGKVVDWTGKPAPAATTTVHVELLHLEADYGYGADEESGESRYDRWLRAVPEGAQDVAVTGGVFHLDVTPGQADVGYVVRVTSGKAKTELTLDGSYPYDYYAGYGEGERVDQTPRPAKATQLALELPKAIQVGVPTQVKVLTPYRGRVLWTVETDHIITAQWADVAAGAASWSFTLADFAPNVYVSAFVVKDPHLESKDAFLPDRAFGIASATVTPVAFTQEVKLDAPKEVRSGSPLTITVDIGPGAGPTYATVAVVDEGILSLTNFATPNPIAQLFARRALGVETYETIGWTMLHQPAGASSRTGGGDEGSMDAESGGALAKGRVQPVKPVALFSGVVAIGADGKAKIPFVLPAYRGEVRVMAVTTSATRVGRAEAKVAVRDPLVIQATFPRFLVQNDQVAVPVFLTNTTDAPMDVELALSTAAITGPGIPSPKGGAAPLAITGKDHGSVRLAANHAETLVFQVAAKAAFGAARLTVTAHARGAAGALEAKDELEVPLLPAGPREAVTQKLRVAAGRLDVTSQPALKGWVPGSETTTLWMTNNPYGEALSHLDYLIHYPYGCIEQTTSTTRPLIHLASLVGDADPALAELKIEDMVLAGINRVLSMETPSGGFGYWPGDTEPLEWATAYATDMLLDAKAAGYAVPAERLAHVLTWIEGRVATYERFGDPWQSGGMARRQPWSHYDEQAEAYLHYVLARAGKAHKARIATILGKLPATARGELAEDRYLLQAALYLAGDRRYEAELKAVDSGPIAPERINSWSFYSDLRRRGMMLSIFHDLFGNAPAGEALAQRVGQALTGQASRGYNTQELVWGVTALGKWVTGAASHGTAGGTLTADGGTIAARPHPAGSKSTDKTWSLVRASEYAAVGLDVPASADGMWLMVQATGVRAGGDYKVGGNGLAVRRSYHTLGNVEVDPAAGTVKLGDLLFVTVEVENTSGAEIENLALVDRLPAGFEIENPRLGRTTKPDWVKDEDQWATDFMNLRDDHLEAFGKLPPKAVRQVVYTVRAVTSGTFTLPPVELEAMYDPTLWARARGGTAVVGGPWTGKTL